MITASTRLLRTTALAGIVTAISPMLAHADEAAGAEGMSDEILVTGSIVASQQASVEAKRKADNLADIASADAAARFPDQNAAAALARLPAVAVQRDQGQERYIQVRGAPNRWTSVSIDGIPMVGVDEGGDTRAFRFDAIPAVLLSEMVINKSLTANLQADAVVATIDLKTFSPMQERGLHVSGDLGYGLMGLGEGEQRQGSLRLSWSNDNFGFVVGGSHYRRKQLTDNREFGGYDENGPTSFDIRQYKLERWNNGLFAGVEYEPAAGQRIYVKAIFSEFNDNEQRNQYVLNLSGAGVTGTRGAASGSLQNVGMNGSFNFGEYRNRNYIGTIGGEYDDLEGFTVAFKANYARTKNTSFLPMVRSSMAENLGFSYDAGNPNFPIVSFDGEFDQANLSNRSAIVIPGRQQTVSDSYTAKLDLAREMGDLTLSAGGLYIDRDIAGTMFSFVNYVPLAYGAAVGQPFDINSYVTDTPWDSDFPLGFTLNYVDNIAMRRDVDSLLGALAGAGLYDPSLDVHPESRYAQREKTLAAYAMAKIEAGPLTAVGGLRMERYTLDNSGSVLDENGYTPLALHTTKTDFFPSLNLRYEAANNLVLRLAGQRGVSRPAYGAIRVGASINDTTTPGSIGGGNPFLKPEYTWGADASVEYYLPGNGLISIASFYRWVDNVLYQSQQVVGTDFYGPAPDGSSRAGYLLSGTYNGEKGKLYGIEFNVLKQFDFLPGALSGFGFQGNLTLLDGSFDTPDETGIAFQGMSDTIANASLFYEKYGLSARVSYQWRSDWLDTLGGLGSGEYRKGYENLDVSLRYALTDNFTLFADLANLTNETYVAFQDNASQPTEVERIGSRYLFGVRFSY